MRAPNPDHEARRRRRAGLAFPTLLLMTLAAGCQDDSPGRPDRGAALFGTCVPCHGPDGGGSEHLGAPAIAGQQAWYLRDQLQNFRTAKRGAHPDDVNGLRMRPMARTLETDADVDAVVDYVSKLPPVRVPASVQGDPEKGKVSYATCINCHGPKAEGIESQKAPSLFMTGDWYQLAQLEKYKSGVRGTNPKNPYGMVMRGMAMGLADEQAMKNVVAYIQTLNPMPATAGQ